MATAAWDPSLLVGQPPATAPPWYALKVRPRHEKTVCSTLAAKGFEVFLPSFRSRRRWSDRIKQVDLPLFDTYLFSRVDLEDQVSVLRIPGTVHIVSQGAVPVPVAEEEIARVRRILSSGLILEPWRTLSPGQRVRLEAGPLQGIEGILIQFRGAHRLIVSVPLLQRSISVEIDGEWAAPAGLSREIWRFAQRPRDTTALGHA